MTLLNTSIPILPIHHIGVGVRIGIGRFLVILLHEVHRLQWRIHLAADGRVLPCILHALVDQLGHIAPLLTALSLRQGCIGKGVVVVARAILCVIYAFLRLAHQQTGDIKRIIKRLIYFLVDLGGNAPVRLAVGNISIERPVMPLAPEAEQSLRDESDARIAVILLAKLCDEFLHGLTQLFV